MFVVLSISEIMYIELHMYNQSTVKFQCMRAEKLCDAIEFYERVNRFLTICILGQTCRKESHLYILDLATTSLMLIPKGDSASGFWKVKEPLG